MTSVLYKGICKMSNDSFKQWQVSPVLWKMSHTLSLRICFKTSEGGGSKKHSLSSLVSQQSSPIWFSLLAAQEHLSSAVFIHSMCINICGGHAWFMLSGRESPDIQGFSLLQKTLSSILGQKVVQQPQQTTTSLEKPATKTKRERETRVVEKGTKNRETW